ncbi:threonine--tRNA ligase [Candidatus Wolfebacteria bacterium CG18_big_fil_WC_8_21_14_2_50_39_7]|uniref:Threonine--tRNA ligase n=5 Tax=Candidatus Wolfeibacteriota TaxID=1752735 RepID=A0A2M7Q750_9BACT|nr:threonine--tRNA ligase [Parcubacteria group bacterium]NCO89545.1 threonine--tRNA ligase [Candidatus Wolfebacteria bacterium]OIO65122.1 MAG: threonine--tRNA ligase [Candidatus Wolfebacteria bacterium CG1_02_39_135]PIP92278.1 MAG: threonine--tRNA ligase [Candidatus Wolfebacteria bacterium CG18_big_fil_WC_8_21_14_2_50_39_7]PIU98892.1 MAG: threonine--tRNA ligase [Candidatus Wolfebacteria bacterium CG03_land_8_20_14_0_80_39_317]PIY58910.1 MAG: threonine--tRNA ligase [Candidatus Wolfebacteria bac
MKKRAWKKENQLDTLRHSTSHILAAAVLEMFPKTKFGIGPTIENGFYYDFDNIKISEADLPQIEKQMRELIKKDLKFKKEIVSFAEAKKLFKDQPYKLDLIKELQKNKKKISIYKTSDSKNIVFLDLCAGPHVNSTKEINPDAFKLTKIAGAYWRGDEKNKMLTRIYGVAFATKKELDEYSRMIEEAEKRDHRLLGQKLDLFHLDEEFGLGLPLWHPKGALLRQIIEDYSIKEYLQNGYQLLRTPHIARLDLWKKSGHWNFYRENMYSPMEIEKEKYVVKPMNCPGHILIYNHQPKSYRDLPLRFAELGTVYRYEKSGVLHGLTRVRGFTQDDAHIFCAPNQINQEITDCLKLGLKVLKIFGFKEYDIYLSTRPQKYIGTIKNWGKATAALKYALEKNNLKYQVDPGEGVFYGPKIDLKIKDSLGRPWQCTTIQIDFNLPEKFDVSYINEKGKKEQPIMIHRALLGSIERFVGVLLEHFSGALPLWLSPVQLEIINVGSGHRQYAKEIYSQLLENNIRASISDENLTVSKRIREAEIQKIPYILIVGDKELKNKTVNVRHYRRGQEGEIKIEKLIEKLKKEIENKTI